MIHSERVASALRLRVLADCAGVSNAEIAQRTRQAPQAISHQMVGRRRPRSATFAAIFTIGLEHLHDAEAEEARRASALAGADAALKAPYQ